MSKRLIIGLMGLFTILGIALWLWFIHPGPAGPFRSELVPELVVFCIEAFILVGVLSLIQRSLEQRRRRQLWLSLRGSFRDLLSQLDIAFLDPDAEPTPSKELETDPRLVAYMIEQLSAKHPALDNLLAIKREAEETLSLTRDLVAVAAQLSATHMNWWIAIVDSIRQVSIARSRAHLEKSLNDMLVNIQEFDRLEF
ncbi:MAG: hypothetical protein V2J10_06640 [Wenzhouxiangella sp.]|nr:hypothetical protein [Wenzhouxiangella sp.]